MEKDLDIQIIDFIDLINETLSNKFVERWKFKFSEKFLKQFQLKILHSLNKQRPIKLQSLYSFLVKKRNYAPEQVDNFFESIDIDLYRPLIQGKITR